MRAMVLVKATEDSKKGFVPSPENTEMLPEGLGTLIVRQGRNPRDIR
jgi:hypothetical protein